MTFCIGIKVREGIVALADSRIVMGSAEGMKQKLSASEHPDGAIFAMTSGLRTVRDKTLTYLAEVFQQQTGGCLGREQPTNDLATICRCRLRRVNRLVDRDT